MVFSHTLVWVPVIICHRIFGAILLRLLRRIVVLNFEFRLPISDCIPTWVILCSVKLNSSLPHKTEVRSVFRTTLSLQFFGLGGGVICGCIYLSLCVYMCLCVCVSFFPFSCFLSCSYSVFLSFSLSVSFSQCLLLSLYFHSHFTFRCVCVCVCVINIHPYT